jgi:hypothetical protein
MRLCSTEDNDDNSEAAEDDSDVDTTTPEEDIENLLSEVSPEVSDEGTVEEPPSNDDEPVLGID